MCLFQVLLLLSSTVPALVGTCPSAVIYCPPPWQLWGRSCYRFTDEPADWNTSQSACQTMGGKMGVPYSMEENEFMIKMAQKEKITKFWIGCTDIEREGTWVCEGQGAGEPFFKWMPNQPSNFHGNQHCANSNTTYRGEGNLKDLACDRKSRAICTLQYPCSPLYTQVRHYCFATDTNGHLLNSCLLNHVIREFVTKSNPSCTSACIVEPACRSFNIKRNHRGQKICQLNNATRWDDQAEFRDIGSFSIYAHECVD